MDSPLASLHLDAVEEYLFRFEIPRTVAITPSDVQTRATIGFRVEPTGLAGIFRKTWIMYDDATAIEAARDFVPRIMSKANPFWERFSDQREILKMLRADSEEGRNYGGPDHFRAKKAVALTFLLDGKEAARKFAEAKLLILRGDQQADFQHWMARALE